MTISKKIMMIRSLPLSRDVRIKKEAEVLVKNGYDVMILIWDRDLSCMQTDVKTGYTTKRLKLSVLPGSIKVAFCLPIWWLFIFVHLINEKWDVVHAADFDTFVPALIMAKIKRKPIIYDIFDFYADMIGFPILPKVSRKTIGRIDKFLMKFVDSVIIADESRIEQIGGNANRHVVTIINSPKEDVLKNIIVENTKKDNFVIFFGGGISEDRSIDKVILAIQDMINIELIVMGPCGTQRYEKKIREMSRDVKNVKLFLRTVAHEKIMRQTINADLLFALYDPVVPNNRYASPNKLFEAMMCGKPILVNDGTSMANIVRNENCGLVVPYGDVDAIKEVVIKLKNDLNLRQTLGKNGRRAYEEKYSWEIMKTRLCYVYKDIAN